ncbi:MAG: NAD(P)-dependent alcohol dehydrogenase [Saprospiraceae bacterium]|nr:NAD(P)-dependent alcohol dehydrogenase [Pyrinomonadaceae bacterium]
MKAYELQQFGIDNLTLVEKEIPQPGFNEVLIKFHAFSLNYRDLMLVDGRYNPRAKFPVIPFSDGAGEVAAIGEGVSKWKVGDRVCPIFMQAWGEGGLTSEKSKTALGGGGDWDGVLREFGTFNEQGLVKVPEHLSFEEAATLPCAAVTAWNALAVSGRVKAGDTVLTQGTGGVSIFAIQFAKLFGARIIATSSSHEKLDKARELGARETVNYKAREDWDKAVLELTGKRGVDHVVEVGGTGTMARSVNAVRAGGHIAVIGVLTTSGDFNPISLLMKAVKMQGIFVGSRAMFEDMNKAVEVNKLKPVIDKVFAFGEVREALKYMESGSHFGKIVVRIGD